MSNKLEAKDLINVGIFSAIYFVMFFIAGMTGFIPIFTVLYPCVLAILGGIPFILFLTKVKKFGMITLMGIIMGLITFAMGQGWYVIIFGIVCGLFSDLIIKAGEYKSWKNMLASYCVFSIWVIGSMLPMWLMRETYFEHVRATQGDTYAEAVLGLLTNWMIPVIVLAVIVCAIIGAYIGKGVLKKHFKRAGIV